MPQHTRISISAFVVGALLLCVGCATPDYWARRGRDAGDIVSAAVGLGAGAKVRVGPLHAGWLMQMDFYGWRGGGFINRPPTGVPPIFEIGKMRLNDIDWTFGCTETQENVRDRFKGFRACGGIPCEDWDCWAAGWPMLTAAPGQLSSEWAAFNPYYSQCEVCFGLVGTVRLGVNPAEFADFILGCFGVDFFNDDGLPMVLPTNEESRNLPQ